MSRTALMVGGVAALAFLVIRSKKASGGGGVYPNDQYASPHFSWAELTHTSRNMANEPDNQARINLVYLAQVLEELRTRAGGLPISITSAYRSPAVNAAVGGAPGSDHMQGKAADIYHPLLSHDQLAAILSEMVQDGWDAIDQVIVERHTGHLHVAIEPLGGKARFLETPDGASYVGWNPR